jgi:uncharacterized protein
MDLPPELRASWVSLERVLRPLGGAAVAFSGGADSALVLRAALEFLPAGRVVAFTGRSESLKPTELEAASALARSLRADHRILDTDELNDPLYARNGTDRCFRCKTELYARVGAEARALDLPVVLDGLNADDPVAERPGTRAAAEAGVRSPLREAGLDKATVRSLSRALGLPTWDKPAEPCLSSRVPFGTPVTPEVLDRIRRAEEVLAGLGFVGGRVRHHGTVARVEIPLDSLDAALAPDVRQALVEGIRAAGYTFVALDLAGYRSGSAHEALRSEHGTLV